MVRGIHFADIPPSQSKYVTCTRGAVLDFVIDIRTGSPKFGEWDSVRLDDVDRKAIYLSEGLGHAFVALTDDATVSYLVTDTYHAEREHGINSRDGYYRQDGRSYRSGGYYNGRQYRNDRNDRDYRYDRRW